MEERMKGRLDELSAPFKFRDFRFLWSAQVFSEIGDSAGRLAVAVSVAQRTHSTFLTALVTTVSVLPYLGLGQVLATIVNRFPRQRTIVLSDLARAAIFASLTIRLPIAAVLLLMFVAGCFTPPFEAAKNSLTVLTVPRERYADAVAVVGITFDLSLLFGYAAGGGLIALIGTTPALIANAASFVLSAILLSNIPAARLRPTDGALVRVRDGWRALVDDPFIRRFFVGYTVVAGCAMVGESLVAIYALEVLRRGAGLSGLLAAAIPVGAILVTVASRSRGTETAKIRRASEIALLGSLAALPIFVAGADLPLILLGFAGIGALNASRIPAIEVAVLRLDDRMRGPSFSIIQGFVLGSQAMCAALGGLVARTVGVRQAIVISLIISATVGLWGTLRPPHEIRHAVRTTTTPR